MSQEKFQSVINDILEQKRENIEIQLKSVKSDLLNQMDSIIELSDFMDYRLPDSVHELNAPAEPEKDDTIDTLHTSSKSIAQSVNQLSLINNLLAGINSFCTRAALFLLRDDKLVGWRGSGFTDSQSGIKDEEIKKIFFSLSADTVFKHVLENKASHQGSPQFKNDDHLIYNRFGGAVPEEVFILPFFVKGKPQAVIYCDTMDSSKIHTKEIEILSTIGEMSLDLLPLRQKILSRVKTQEFIGDMSSEPEEINNEKPAEPAQPAPQQIRKNDPERKARVIINDIILYNQKAVEDGIANKNLYNVMGSTIEQARDEFLRKFDDLSIFENQLVRLLAKGDKEALRGYRFETL